MKIDYSDPLKKNTIKALIAAKDESQIVDYKATFVSDNKHWFDISKDCVSFANNKGGYLIFGINDDFTYGGLSEDEVNLLTHTSNIQQKVASNIDLEIEIKTCQYAFYRKTIVAWFISPSIDLILFKKDGKYRHPKGQEGHSFRRGNIYVRRNSGNQLMTSKQLSTHINKKVQFALKDLLASFSAVAKNPREYQLTRRLDAKPIRLSSDPRSTPVHGISFSTTPETLEEKVAANVALYKGNPSNKIDPELLCEARSHRIANDDINYTMSQSCLLAVIPTLFWFEKLSVEDREGCLLDAIDKSPSLDAQFNIAKMSNICGSTVYRKVCSKLHSVKGREIDQRYNKNIRNEWVYTTNLNELPTKIRDVVDELRKLTKDLKSTYKERGVALKMLYLEYTMYFMTPK